ncbi:nucleoside hydrolase [Microvirga puerhi]|uniref:Nucleoside hydrolase n=1 Tax=Microvirga puerhi TaxID=2876078 RepID=A0ABS7VQB2_9HYPH|nr:nucleoside hydrolase [Microvirga puerhi]MBZ6077743.1 nucleoside hydrolase [Microvirga puerhi]
MGVWIDTDMGFDDILAILIVSQSPLVIDGISLVFGNAPLETVKNNAARAAKALRWTYPIHSGRAKSVLGTSETAQNVLGASGIPTSGQSLPPAAPLAESNAFLALTRWLETTADDAPKRILALGPLTNIAALALARPDLASRIGDLVWMGGGVTGGNHTPSAEFNAYADPEALAIVVASGIPLRMVDLDVCRKVLVAPSAVVPIREAGGRYAAVLADLLEGFINIAIQRRRPAMALYDPIAAIAFTRPDIVHFKPARIEVELGGFHTRGRTIVDSRYSAAFNAQIADDIDIETARNLVLEALRQEAMQ